MFIKPERKTKNPKTMKVYTIESKTIDLNEYIPPIDPSQLSLNYLLENKVITILSKDYVIEYGKNYGRDEVEQVTRGGRDYMCYPDDMGYPDDLRDYSGLFSGVLYETWGDMNLSFYTHYKDGLKDGTDVEFYSSGKVKNYCVWKNNLPIGYFYEWYENGRIKRIAYYYPDGVHYEYTDFDENGNVIKHIPKKVR